MNRCNLFFLLTVLCLSVASVVNATPVYAAVQFSGVEVEYYDASNWELVFPDAYASTTFRGYETDTKLDGTGTSYGSGSNAGTPWEIGTFSNTVSASVSESQVFYMLCSNTSPCNGDNSGFIGYVELDATTATPTVVTLPFVDEDFIIIESPVRDTAYDTTITGRFNNLTGNSATTTYMISFLSQSGIDYSDLTIVASSTDSLYDFSHDVQFEQDDIVFVKAYLYDDDSLNADNLIDISPEYEWWVSANANPTEMIDLGMYRTFSTSTCAGLTGLSTSTPWYSAQAFANAGCEVMAFLFVPYGSVVDSYEQLSSTTRAKFPFAYVSDLILAVESESESISSSTPPTLTLNVFNTESVVLSTTTMQQPFGYNLSTLKSIVSVGLVLIFIVYARSRILLAIRSSL